MLEFWKNPSGASPAYLLKKMGVDSSPNIIQKLDRRMSLEDIAASQQCSVEELLDAIEGIVASGTKVGLDYVLEEYLDEDSIEELWDCFMESEQGTVAEVLEEMEDAYSEEEIRLGRIKFMSEVAN